MADGVTFQSATPATPAAGVEVATDDAGAAGHVQIVKLAIAADGSATVLPGDATDGLLVNLGTNNDVTLASGAEVKITDGTDDLVVNSDGSVNVQAAKGTTAFTDPAPTTSASLVLDANTDRKTAIIQNVGSVDVYLGPSGVTTTTGILLAAGRELYDDASTSAWYGITASGTADLRVCEIE